MSGQSIKTLDQRTVALAAGVTPISMAGLGRESSSFQGVISSGDATNGYTVLPIAADNSTTFLSIQRVFPLVGGVTFSGGQRVTLVYDAGDETVAILSASGSGGGGGDEEPIPIVPVALRYFTA
jgi:hypothetical protein